MPASSPAPDRDKLSLLFIDTERIWRGGQEQLLTLLAGLHQRGHILHLACPPDAPLQGRAREVGVLVHPLTVRSELGLLSLVRLISMLRRIRPDILGFNTPKAVLIGSLASRITSIGAGIVFRRVSFPLRRNLITRLKYRWRIAGAVAISDSIRRELEAGGVLASRVHTIYEGVDLSSRPRRAIARTGRGGQPVVVGVVAHLSREKNIDQLIRAAAMIPRVDEIMRFVIIGDGACRQELEQLARELRVDGVFEFAGFRADPWRTGRTGKTGGTEETAGGFDILVLPSLSEGLPSAVLEAMANSLPVVATNVGGLPELVEHGVTGLLVPPSDPPALARALERLAADPQERRAMGERGRDRVEERFTMERKILETEKLCRRLARL